ncbi:MAG: type II toxin-antitoxin system HipA family toxin [Gammaproteobacteria bacterium]|nr:type II toxin-antitoxin system HipA family toxin [Gammaproteobacteria bacterium]
MTDASVELWGRRIGAVSWDEVGAVGVFQYEPAFAAAGIELSPLVMPVREGVYVFPALGRDAFKGLPGLLADALPDSFGNRLIDMWLAETGRGAESFSPVDRLCYVGTRGMGALEFRPAIRGRGRRHTIEVAELVDLANRVLDDRAGLAGRLGGDDDRRALEDILSVGTSAGGARAKAVLAWNPASGEFRSGQVDTAAGFEHWILKFDGVANNRVRELADPLGFGRIEYAYSRMARAAGVEMARCRLHHEGGRSHFMTRRFDRDADGRKLHMQTLGALRHFDYNVAGAYAYEQAVETIRLLGLGMGEVEQQVRRAVFNVVARNQDDHVKNIAFLMDRRGEWQLSPAYDVAYAYNVDGPWTREHQMSLSGKRRGFERDDLLAFATGSGLKGPAARRIIDEVVAAVADWPRFAADAGVPTGDVRRVARAHRLALGTGRARTTIEATWD